MYLKSWSSSMFTIWNAFHKIWREKNYTSAKLHGNYILWIYVFRHKSDIEEICMSASRELELEIKQRVTEDEWNEQMLTFEHYKNRGPMFLDKVSTERLLEQLEDAQALLASMLTSKYIAPLRDDTALWAKKLKDVTEVLELWLQVQDLWQYLEAVFSNSVTAKELQLEAKRFARTDKSWTKMMKTTYFEMRGVLQVKSWSTSNLRHDTYRGVLRMK